MVDIQFKYGANNVPRISDTEIERHAMLFIQDYNTDLLKIPQPLDVEDFAEGYLGLNFHYTNLSHTGFIWGRMVFNNTMIIVYDSEKNIAEEEPIRANTRTSPSFCAVRPGRVYKRLSMCSRRS